MHGIKRGFKPAWPISLVMALALTASLPAVTSANPLPGPVVVNDGAQWTNDPLVSVALPFPNDNSGLVRLSGDGRHIEWSQIGIGFGIGMLLAIGLGLSLRATRPRTLAH